MVARNFCCVSSTRLFISDSTILRFRHFIEQHGLAQKFLERTVNLSAEAGACSFDMVAADGTFIEAPSSTKNKAHARDPEMKRMSAFAAKPARMATSTYTNV